MNLLYYGGLGPDGCGGSHPSSLLLPFNQQLHSNVNTIGGLKVGQHQNQHAVNPFCHSQNSHYSLSQIAPACLPPSMNNQDSVHQFTANPQAGQLRIYSKSSSRSMNNQDSVHQQFTANPQAGQLRMQQFGYASNPDVVGTSNTQSGFQFSACHYLTARPNQVDGHMQNSSQNPYSSSGNPGPNSGPQPGHLSNPSMIGTSNALSGFNSFSCQYLTSPDQVDGSVQNSSYNPCASSGHPGPSSGFQPGCSSSDYHDILEESTLAELNAILPSKQHKANSAAYF